MNNPFASQPVQMTGLDEAIEQLLLEMRGFTADSKEYAKMADQLKKLYKLRALDKPERVSADTKALILANLLGIAMILEYERAHVVTSKALAYLPRLIR